LSCREAARSAIVYAFELIELDAEDPRDRPFVERRAGLRDWCAMPGSAFS
jgi:ATP-dependent DNA ligase